MNTPPMNSAPETADSDPSEELALTTRRIRAAVRQHQSLSAVRNDQLSGWPASLEAVRRHETLVEPTFDTGKGIVAWLQRVTYHLFSKRGHRTLLSQQNEFNRQVGLALREICEKQRQLGEALAEFDQRNASSSHPQDPQAP